MLSKTRLAEIDAVIRLQAKPDIEIAERFGLDVRWVGRRRRLLGVPVVRKPHDTSGMNHFDWECAAVRDEIGTTSDSVIARKLGCSRQAVQNYRKKHGIPSWCETRVLDVDWGAVDWRYSDNTIQHKYGISSRAHIAAKRLELGFPYVGKHKWERKGRQLPESVQVRLRAVVGTKADYRVAAEFGVSAQTVGRYRRRWGIPVYGDLEGRVSRRIDWGLWDDLIRGWDGLLGELRLKIGCSLSALAKRREKLGLISEKRGVRYDWSVAGAKLREGWSDEQVSAEFGIGLKAIYRYRQRHGIGIQRLPKFDWSKIDGLLGTMSDVALSRETGVAVSTISGRRYKLGIKAWEK